MIDLKTEVEKRNEWYNSSKFSLIPLLRIKKADEWNTSGFTFEWLFIKIWTLDACEFEITFTISGHWGLGFTILFPYLRFVFCIPFPWKLEMWMQRHLWRKSLNQKNYGT